MKRLTAVIVTILLLFSIATGCSPKENKAASTDNKQSTTDVYKENGLPKDKKVTLSIAVWENGYGKNYWNSWKDSFEKKYPNVTIKYTFSPNISDIVNTKILANDPGMFDMFSADNVDVSGLIKNQKIVAIDDIFDQSLTDTSNKKIKDIDSLYESRKGNTIDGKNYYAAYFTSLAGLFYDKNLFEKNGWNQDPKTWDEFLQLCESIKQKGITPLAYTGIYSGYWANAFGAKFLELADEAGDTGFKEKWMKYQVPTYSNQYNLEVWKRMKQLSDKGYFYQGIAGINHTQSQMLMLQDKVALVSTGNWVANEMKDAVPSGFQWGYMNVPFVKTADKTLHVVGGEGDEMLIWDSKSDLNTKWAKEFYKWWFTLDSQSALAKAGAIPVRNDLGSHPEALKDVDKFMSSFINYTATHKIVVEDLSHDASVKADNSMMTQAKKKYEENIVPMTLGKVDSGDVLKSVDDIITKAIQKGEK
ncbi:MAG TPA: extracellular solute-binding protein [Caproiciproducens sp.]|nr:extracellular solute-binding protein [Caproiciproducens sp.]